jgi:hypothetical protein
MFITRLDNGRVLPLQRWYLFDLNHDLVECWNSEECSLNTCLNTANISVAPAHYCLQANGMVVDTVVVIVDDRRHVEKNGGVATTC